MRLGLALLAFAAVMGGAGFSRPAGPTADYFWLVSSGCLVLSLCLLVGRVGAPRRVTPGRRTRRGRAG